MENPSSPVSDEGSFSSMPAVRRVSTNQSKRDSFILLEKVFEPADEEGSTWHHLPLVFALVPAITGLFFTGGHFLLTDVLLLGLASLYLHYLVRFPWEWYKSAQTRVIELDEASRNGQGSGVVDEDDAETKGKRQLARKGLERDEILGLLCCFVGPIVGGVLLAYLRSSLSRPSEGLVSTFNITLFVMAAELRPASQVIHLIRQRSWRLQEVVHSPPSGRLERMVTRMDELEALMQTVIQEVDSVRERDLVSEVRWNINPDLEALNRAVRRYEKREALSTTSTAMKLRNLETQLNEMAPLLSTIAVAQNRQRFSYFHSLYDLIDNAISFPFFLIHKAVLRPLKTAIPFSTGKAKPPSSSSKIMSQASGKQARSASKTVYKRGP